MRRGFNRYIGPGPWELWRGPWISEGPHRLNVLFCFFFIFCGYFQLFLVYFYLLSGHYVAQEINHLWQFTKGFIGPHILKVILFRRAKFLLEALFQYAITADYPFRNETKSEWSRQQIENRGNNVSNGKRRWRQLWGSHTCHNNTWHRPISMGHSMLERWCDGVKCYIVSNSYIPDCNEAFPSYTRWSNIWYSYRMTGVINASICFCPGKCQPLMYYPSFASFNIII